MQHQLKQNLLALIKEQRLSMNMLEQDAGLHKNFISNFLRGKSKNPGIDSIIKISRALNVSVDELIGTKSDQKIYDLDVTQKEIFSDVVNYLTASLKLKNLRPVKLEIFFDAIYEVYKFSLTKNRFDKEFADWFINSHF